MKALNLKSKISLLLLMLLSVCCLVGCKPDQPDVEDPDKPDVEEPTEKDDLTEKFGLYVKAGEDGKLKIAQFADLHFGINGRDYHNNKVERTIAYMDYVVKTAKPDLIVCSGDNILATGVKGLEEFVELMDKYETPWVFMYGNHDAESNQSGYRKSDLSNWLDSCDSEYLLYETGYSEKGTENRFGNFTVSVLDHEGKNLLGGIIIFDAGTHTGTEYQTITKGQISWYQTELTRLQELAKSDTIPSTIAFSHIQLPEFYTAYQNALNKQDAEFVIEQELSADAIKEIAGGGPSQNNGLFDCMVEKGSTTAYFVGHAHTNKFQVKMDGITLGFAPQVGYSKSFDDNDLARNCYVYTLDTTDFSFTTDNYPEQLEGIGFAYSGTYEGEVNTPNEKGEYVVEATFVLWNRLEFSFDGVRLTPENTTITGYFINKNEATWNEYLYTSDGERFIYSANIERTYIFTYNPTTKTLNVGLKESQEKIDYDKISIDGVNADQGADKAAVWTKANYKLRDGAKDSWVGNGWRYIIVCDSEGRICYAVTMPPNGYGGPTGNGYYCNGYYTDYTKNPAIRILEGFGPWTKEDPSASKLFDIVVPEGGFAITAHGAAIGKIVACLSNGEVSNTSEKTLNARGVYSDGLRLVWDATSSTVKITRGNN